MSFDQATPSPAEDAAQDIFASTQWTVVLHAGQRSDPQAHAALEELCRTYWFPLYAYVRRRGYAKEEAEDLTQAFFVRFLQKDYLSGLKAERGRFRAFLLAALKHFLANEYDKAHRQKRSPATPNLSLDWATADTQFQLAATCQLGPDQAYDREWALALLAKVIRKLETEQVSEGRGRQFERLKSFLTSANPEAASSDIARELEMSGTAVRVAIHRLRKRYRQLLQAEMVQTLADPALAHEELRSLFTAFSS
jgi:DNA-directed RNA polymerase specialized sigma24 family protein